MLEARRGLDRRDDLARNAELGEAAERSLLLDPEIPDRFVQPDQALLNEVLGVAAGEEIRARLQPNERRVAAQKLIKRLVVAVPSTNHQLQILKFSLNLLGRADCYGGLAGHRFSLHLRVLLAPISR